jgi:hypothetical protein
MLGSVSVAKTFKIMHYRMLKRPWQKKNFEAAFLIEGLYLGFIKTICVKSW